MIHWIHKIYFKTPPLGDVLHHPKKTQKNNIFAFTAWPQGIKLVCKK